MMKMLTKIRALFTHQGKENTIELSAAEIRGNKVTLHPKDNADETICIRASTVDLLINESDVVQEKDFFLFRKRLRAKVDLSKVEKKKDSSDSRSSASRRQAQENPAKPAMKTVSFRVYPDEYDALMEIIESNGYRKAEYLLACVHAAKKKSMEAMYAQYYDTHAERRKAARLAAKQIREQKANMTVSA